MRLIFRGVVQGVGFRPLVYRIASELGLRGYVYNKGSEVEVVVDRDADLFISMLKERLPEPGRITGIVKEPDDRFFPDFRILYSENGDKSSLVPVDICICDDCLREMFTRGDRRYLYPFTNCSICGARFSLINNVPYDRGRTAMGRFSMCSRCLEEYSDPGDRRYHAQTISCPDCGPRTMLYDKTKGLLSTGADAIREFASYIDDGCIGVVKSWGGMHLCCVLDELERFREWYKRPEKPFAVMVRDIEAAERYAYINEYERGLLLSKARPIVLLDKKIKDDRVSPGLGNIGLYLPYTGVQYILFSFLRHDALVMTSANTPGEPMVTCNDEAFRLNADYYLLHEQDIVNRIDDSVVRVYNDNVFFIRKSRGFIPDCFDVDYDRRVLSVGAGENIQAALSNNRQLYTTQYIGDSSYYNTLVFLEEAIDHLICLTMNNPGLDYVAVDLHPGYGSRRVAGLYAERYKVPIYEVQHHWAHAASLLFDNNIDEAVVLALDGLGYGDDGCLWGGEVLSANTGSYKRIGHLEYIPMLGGDQATRDPRRLVFAIFDRFDVEVFFTGEEADILRRMRGKSLLSSSMGRLLDALSCYLGVCSRMTYDGEPAMKLEPYLANGRLVYDFEYEIEKGVLYTCELFRQLYEYTNGKRLTEKEKSDLSYSFVYTVLKGLMDIAIDHASEDGVKNIGVTGGVSYNTSIVRMVKKMVDEAGLTLLIHHRVPNGDGGISIGQNVIAGSMHM